MNQLRYLLMLVFLGASASFEVLGQEPVWLKHYVSGGQNRGMRLCWNGEGGLFGIGTLRGDATLDGTEVSVLGSEDILIVRWDTTGNIIWAQTAGGDCEPGDDDDGGYIHYEPVYDRLITTGYFTCPSTYFGVQVLNGAGPLSGMDDGFIAAYNLDGDCIWARRISAAPNLGLASPLSDPDGNVFLVGTGGTSSTTFHGSTVVTVPSGGFLAKYSSAGSLMYAERILINGNLGGTCWANPTEMYLSGSIKPGGSLFGQSVAATTVMGEGFIALADTSGTVNWVTTFPSTGSALILRPILLPGGACAVSGLFTGNLELPDDTLYGSASMYSSFVARLTDQGEVEWIMPFSANGHALVYDLDLDPQGDLLVYGRFEGELQIGQTSISSVGSNSGLLCRLDSDGSLKAATTFARVSSGSGSVLTTDQGLYLSSGFDSTMTLGSTVIQGSAPSSGDDLFLARFDSLSGFTHVPAPKVSTNQPLHIYANPNNGICTIELPQGIAIGSTIRLIVRDAQGQLVLEAPCVVGERGTVPLDISAQARGMYQVELADERRRYTGKVVFE